MTVTTSIEIKTYREKDEHGTRWVALVEWVDSDGGRDGQETEGATPTEALKAMIVELAESNAEYLEVLAKLTGLE